MADENEFADFVRASSPRLLWVARLLCNGDRSAAEDLVQDALVETFRKWTRVEHPEARLAYARRVMVRTATRRWRARDRLVELSTPNPPPSASVADRVDADSVIDLRAALRKLSARQRAVLVLRYYEDLSEAQIAAALGCSHGSVKKHASRGIAALSAELRQHDPDRSGEEQR